MELAVEVLSISTSICIVPKCSASLTRSLARGFFLSSQPITKAQFWVLLHRRKLQLAGSWVLAHGSHSDARRWCTGIRRFLNLKSYGRHYQHKHHTMVLMLPSHCALWGIFREFHLHLIGGPLINTWMTREKNTLTIPLEY